MLPIPPVLIKLLVALVFLAGLSLYVQHIRCERDQAQLNLTIAKARATYLTKKAKLDREVRNLEKPLEATLATLPPKPVVITRVVRLCDEPRAASVRAPDGNGTGSTSGAADPAYPVGSLEGIASELPACVVNTDALTLCKAKLALIRKMNPQPAD